MCNSYTFRIYKSILYVLSTGQSMGFNNSDISFRLLFVAHITSMCGGFSLFDFVRFFFCQSFIVYMNKHNRFTNVYINIKIIWIIIAFIVIFMSFSQLNRPKLDILNWQYFNSFIHIMSIFYVPCCCCCCCRFRFNRSVANMPFTLQFQYSISTFIAT